MFSFLILLFLLLRIGLIIYCKAYKFLYLLIY